MTVYICVYIPLGLSNLVLFESVLLLFCLLCYRLLLLSSWPIEMSERQALYPDKCQMHTSTSLLGCFFNFWAIESIWKISSCFFFFLFFSFHLSRVFLFNIEAQIGNVGRTKFLVVSFKKKKFSYSIHSINWWWIFFPFLLERCGFYLKKISWKMTRSKSIPMIISASHFFSLKDILNNLLSSSNKFK